MRGATQGLTASQPSFLPSVAAQAALLEKFATVIDHHYNLRGMTLTERVDSDLKDAMRAKDATKHADCSPTK